MPCVSSYRGVCQSRNISYLLGKTTPKSLALESKIKIFILQKHHQQKKSYLKSKYFSPEDYFLIIYIYMTFPWALTSSDPDGSLEQPWKCVGLLVLWCHNWERGDLASKTLSLTVLSWASDPGQFVHVGKMLEKWEVSPSGAVGVWALFGDIESTISRESCEIPQSSLEHTRPNPPLISAGVSPWIRLKLLLVCCCTKSGRNHGWLTPLA